MVLRLNHIWFGDMFEIVFECSQDIFSAFLIKSHLFHFIRLKIQNESPDMHVVMTCWRFLVYLVH